MSPFESPIVPQNLLGNSVKSAAMNITLLCNTLRFRPIETHQFTTHLTAARLVTYKLISACTSRYDVVLLLPTSPPF